VDNFLNLLPLTFLGSRGGLSRAAGLPADERQTLAEAMTARRQGKTPNARKD